MADEPVPTNIEVAAPAPAAPEPAPSPAPAAPEAAAAAHPSTVPTLLEGLTAETPKPEAKPATEAAPTPAPEAKPVEAAKPAEPKPEGAPAEPAAPAPEAPVAYEFKFADSVVPEAEKVAAFTDFAREVKMTPEQAQKAVDYFNDAATSYAEKLQQQQIDVWNETQQTWRNNVMADAQIGGAGHVTATRAIARMRDMSVSSAEPGTPQYDREWAEYQDFLRATGAGNHPAYLRQLHNFAGRLDEPRLPPPNPQPVPNGGKRPSSSLYKQPASPGGRQ